MDIVYIVGTGSTCDNFELRHSLRSIDRYAYGIRNVYCVGFCPDWLSDKVIKVPCNDIYVSTPDRKITENERNCNIAGKILYAIDNIPSLSDEFLISMDDHFYTRTVDFDRYPYFVNKQYNNGFFKKDDNGKPYFTFLSELREILEKNGLPYLYFCIHKNTHINKAIVSEYRDFIDNLIANGMACELIAIVNNIMFSKGLITPTFIDDNKIKSETDWYKTNPSFSDNFSTYDFEKDSKLYALIEERYNEKCKYEKQ